MGGSGSKPQSIADMPQMSMAQQEMEAITELYSKYVYISSLNKLIIFMKNDGSMLQKMYLKL